jgi:probable rRNA maturation factor
MMRGCSPKTAKPVAATTTRIPIKATVKGSLSFFSQVKNARVRKEFVLACAKFGTCWIKEKVGRIDLILVGDAKMTRLHREYMNLRGTTDVMTFDLSDSPQLIEGEIYICLPQAKRQAKVYRVPLYKEVARLAAHGVLHLAGFNDSTETERELMRTLEDQCLKAAERAHDR